MQRIERSCAYDPSSPYDFTLHFFYKRLSFFLLSLSIWELCCKLELIECLFLHCLCYHCEDVAISTMNQHIFFSQPSRSWARRSLPAYKMESLRSTHLNWIQLKKAANFWNKKMFDSNQATATPRPNRLVFGMFWQLLFDVQVCLGFSMRHSNSDHFFCNGAPRFGRSLIFDVCVATQKLIACLHPLLFSS